MSFLGGAECSTAANPLAQFVKHTQDDKSLQRDRLVGRGPRAGFESMRSQIPTSQNDKVRSPHSSKARPRRSKATDTNLDDGELSAAA